MTTRRLTTPAAALILASLAAAPALAQSQAGVPDGQQAPAVVAPPAAPPAQSANPPAAPAGGAHYAYRQISAQGNVVSTLQGSGQFTRLLKAAQDSSLLTVLQTQPGITLFAPTDDAFDAAPPSVKAAMTSTDHAALQHLLAYHLINTKVEPGALKGAASGVASVAGGNVYLDGTKTPPMVNDANVLQAGVNASNGVIYVIDRVLDPSFTPPAAAAKATPGK